MNESHMLTFEVVSDCEEIEIHGDEKGLKNLIFYLQRLLDSKKSAPNHDHLMTPSWAGTELTEVKIGESNKLINKATIYLWPCIESNKSA